MSDATPQRRRQWLRAPDRRRQILDVAERLFAERGYEATSIADICAAAGIARGTLYQYFENKHAVFRAVLARHVEAIRILMDPEGIAPLPDGHDPALLEHALTKRLTLVLHLVAEYRDIYVVLLREAWARHAGSEDLANEILERFAELMRRDLAEAARRGRLDADEIGDLADFVLGGVALTAIRHVLSGEVTTTEELNRVAHRLARWIVRIVEPWRLPTRGEKR